MRQHVVDRDLVPGWRGVRHVLPQRIFDLELAAFLKQENASRSELLRDRTEPELGRRCVRNIPFQICRAVALAENDLVALGHQHRPHEVIAGDVGLHYLLKSRGILRESASCEQEQKGCRPTYHGHYSFVQS